MSGHRLKALGVLDGTDLVGIVTSAQVSRAFESEHVRDIMFRPDRVVDVSTPLRQLAQTFWQEDLDFVAVTQSDRFRGIVTPNLLLKEMARSWDPLTGLSWSDRLREWGVDNLRAGREITILFIDLDDFGSYNKQFGHIVGDRVLQKVSDVIEETLDPNLDVLVRYGGDEFAIGSLRDRAGALDLAKRLGEAMSRVRVAGSEERVTFSIGVQGGKRSKERESTHYAATLDNLINLASRNSMAEKSRKKAARRETAPAPRVAPSEPDIAPVDAAAAEPEPIPTVIEAVPIPPAAKPRIEEVVVDAADANSVTQVSIRSGDQLVSGIAPRKGGSVLKSVALASANALSNLRNDVTIEIHDVKLTESPSGIRLITVVGIARVAGRELPIGGVGTVGRNLYLSVAEATLQSYTNLALGD